MTSFGGEAPFRFGVNMTVPAGRDAWMGKCRHAEDLGYDVIGVADHLGMPAPFPALVLAAEATERVALCSYVLNTSFYNPTLLAREIAGTDQFTGGRLELGLGTGYIKAEFDAAGLPFPGPGARIEHLERTVEELRRLFGESEPKPAQVPGPPLLIGGQGDRMLRLAAREADIVGLTGASFSRDGSSATVATAEEMEARVALVREAAGDRADDVELNLLIQKVLVTEDRESALAALQAFAPEMTAEQLDAVPILLVGTVEQIADQLREQRKRYGFTYITVLETDVAEFAPVLELLKGS